MKTIVGKKTLIKIGEREFIVEGVMLSTSGRASFVEEKLAGTYEPLQMRPPVERYDDEDEDFENTYEDCND